MEVGSQGGGAGEVREGWGEGVQKTHAALSPTDLFSLEMDVAEYFYVSCYSFVSGTYRRGDILPGKLVS